MRLGFPYLREQPVMGHVLTTQVSIDDQPHQNRSPVYGIMKTKIPLTLPAGGPLLQCRWRAARSSYQQLGTQCAIGPHRPRSSRRDRGLLTSEEQAEINRLRKKNRELQEEKDFQAGDSALC